MQGSYQNYQSGPDVNGIQSASIDGPKATITDPVLQAEGVTAHKKLLATEGEVELLDPGSSGSVASVYVADVMQRSECETRSSTESAG